MGVGVPGGCSSPMKGPEDGDLDTWRTAAAAAAYSSALERAQAHGNWGRENKRRGRRIKKGRAGTARVLVGFVIQTYSILPEYQHCS